MTIDYEVRYKGNGEGVHTKAIAADKVYNSPEGVTFYNTGKVVAIFSSQVFLSCVVR